MRVYEIIYNNAEEQIGLKEIDPTSIVKKYSKAIGQFVWIQYDDNIIKRRILMESQILISTDEYDAVSFETILS
jgi:hypothetical protein